MRRVFGTRIQSAGKRRSRRGFSLVEALVACAVLSMIMVAMLAIVEHTSGVWRSANARIESFQGARRAFDILTSMLSQATLNTYWGYDDENNPSRYLRKSELHFVVNNAGEGGLPGTKGCGQGVFFQTPAMKAQNSTVERLTGLLNHCGFYVEYGSDAPWLPGGPIKSEARDRCRLMLWLPDSDERGLEIFRQDNDPSDDTRWIAPTQKDTIPLADNIILLAIWPHEQPDLNNPDRFQLDAYEYNSRSRMMDNPQPLNANQLPPVVEVAMVAIDETSAIRLGNNLQSDIQACLSGLFQDRPSQNFSRDLETLEERLASKNINHRIFKSTVPIQSAQWSP